MDKVVEDFSKQYLGKLGIRAVGWDLDYDNNPYIFVITNLDITIFPFMGYDVEVRNIKKVNRLVEKGLTFGKILPCDQ